MVATDNPVTHKSTDCFVHGLLESQRKLGGGGSYSKSLQAIAESLGSRDPDKETPCDDTVGQEDERSWRQQVGVKHIEEGLADLSAANVDLRQDAAQEAAVRSRLLTKKQLSDMAWGVRELSKRLGSVRLKLRVKNVFLLTKVYDESLIKNTREVVRWLLSPEREVRYTVYVENTLKENKKFGAQALLADAEKEYSEKDMSADGKKLDQRLKYWSSDMCRTRPHTFDFVVTLGGDGTVLYASWLFQRIVPPVLSFALGSLGFLTKFDYDEFADILEKSFRDGVTISLRLRFEGTVMRSQKRPLTDGNSNEDSNDDIDKSRDLVEELVGEEKGDERTHRPDGTYEILNDIVVDRGPNPSKHLLLATHIALRSLTSQSNVLHRDLRRRRTLHLNPSRRRLRRHTHRFNSLQPRRRRLPLPPRKPSYPRNSHLRAHALLPTHHPARHHRTPRRRSVRCQDEQLGEFRRAGEGRVEAGGLCDNQRESVSVCECYAARAEE